MTRGSVMKATTRRVPPQGQRRGRARRLFGTLVDKLLESKHWGEHRARYWLDAARYGDTHGIHIDNYREMYFYRDWVIDAYNDNKPFDELVVEQIAGDLLPNPTLDQLIATGFHRNNITTNEGGAIPEEYEAIHAKDRADTTTNVFLGLTAGCATCQDHKFDPIPIAQREFYALTAFFRNTTQYVMDGNISDPPPVLVVPRDEDRDRWQELRALAAETDTKIDERAAAVDESFAAWLTSSQYRSITNPLEATLMTLRLDSDPQLRLSRSRGNGRRSPCTTEQRSVSVRAGSPRCGSGSVRGRSFPRSRSTAIRRFPCRSGCITRRT